MEIDQLKSATEDQMEMMMMMVQMEKFPDFYGAFNDGSELPPSDTGSNSGTNIASTPYFIDNSNLNAANNNPNIASPSFINLPYNNISYNGTTPVQEPGMPDFLSYSNNERIWRGAGDLSGANNPYSTPSQKPKSVAAMRETIFRIAALQPIHIDPESVKPPKRRNVKISKDPQSVAARHRRERISERIRILQRLVPGGTKMDTASMLDEAIHYVKFLKTQVQSLERAAANRPSGIGFPATLTTNESYLPIGKAYHSVPKVQNYGDA